MLPIFSIPFINLDVQTLLPILFWMNTAAIILVWIYHNFNKSEMLAQLSRLYISAKLFQIIAYFLMHISELYQISEPRLIGDTLFILGYYFEANAMLYILCERNSVVRGMLMLILICMLSFFVFGLAMSLDETLINASISIYLCLLFLLPNFVLLQKGKISVFKYTLAALYICCAVMMLPQAVSSFSKELFPVKNFNMHSITYITLTLVLMSGLTAYLLTLRENAVKLIEKHATTDSLTGVANRHAFFTTASRVFKRQYYGTNTVSLLFVDIDHFKKINDTYGHAFGDEVLKKLAETLECCVRPEDLVCRYGGEEFVVMAIGLPPETCISVAQRIKDAAGNLRFPDRPEFSFSVSIGLICGVPGKDDTLAGFLERSDEALYKAKASGRNCIVANRAGLCLVVGRDAAEMPQDVAALLYGSASDAPSDAP